MTCAIPPGPYDVFGPSIDDARFQRAVAEVENWRRENWQGLLDDDAVAAVVRVAITEYNRSPVELYLPKFGVERGAIRYVTPPVVSARRQRWNAWGPRRKAVDARKRVDRTVAKATAFRKRVADTRAVWNGTKDAYTEAEIDKLTEDCW